LEKRSLGSSLLGLFQGAASFCVFLITYLSLVPSNLEVRTGAPGYFGPVVAYLGMAVLLGLSYPRKPWLIALGLVGYVVLPEMLQSFSLGRSPSILGSVASWSGAALGMAAVGAMEKKSSTEAL
jgi:VanZ family protein